MQELAKKKETDRMKEKIRLANLGEEAMAEARKELLEEEAKRNLQEKNATVTLN